MFSDQEFNEFVKDMQSENLSLRVAGLKVLRQRPSGDKRVLSHLERLLEDKTPCLLSIPFVYGELRWLAAQALAAERAKLGINQPVYLWNVVKPLNSKGYATARRAANIKGEGGLEGVLKNLVILRDMGCLPMVDLKLSYWIDRHDEAPVKKRKASPVPLLAHQLPQMASLPSIS